MKKSDEEKMFNALLRVLSKYSEKGVDPIFIDKLSELIENYMVEHGVVE